jgi:hypothetical protein
LIGVPQVVVVVLVEPAPLLKSELKIKSVGVPTVLPPGTVKPGQLMLPEASVVPTESPMRPATEYWPQVTKIVVAEAPTDIARAKAESAKIFFMSYCVPSKWICLSDPDPARVAL